MTYIHLKKNVTIQIDIAKPSAWTKVAHKNLNRRVEDDTKKSKKRTSTKKYVTPFH